MKLIKRKKEFLMMTKKQFAKMLIRKYKADNNIDEQTDDKDLVKFIYSSSVLAVALETLGVEMSKEEAEYTTSRGGVMFTYANKDENGLDIGILTAREIIEMLPR